MEKPRILIELKTQTRPQHESIERNPFGKAIMDGTMSHSRYKAFLQKFYGFHIPVEQALECFAWADVGISFDERRKVSLLEKDLRSLGMKDSDIALLPQADILPPISTMEEAVGVMYVLEGSTLGGQIQAREVQKMFGFGADNGAAYFSGYGVNVGAMWKGCCEAIARVANNDTLNERMIIEAAKSTFIMLEKWLHADVDVLEEV